MGGSHLRQMSLEEKVGQVLFATYHGSFTSTDSPAYAQMLHSVNDLHVGGFITITHGSPLGIVKSQAYPTAVLNKSTAIQIKAAASDRRRFRTRHRHAPR